MKFHQQERAIFMNYIALYLLEKQVFLESPDPWVFESLH